MAKVMNAIYKEREDARIEQMVSLLLLPGAGSHNALYRGKNLGGVVTDGQRAALADGTFDDLYVGDYWVIGGMNYRIAGFDYFYNSGDTAFAKHHAVIVPDKVLYSVQMNATDTTAGGYTGSAMRTTNLAQAKTTIKADFGDLVLAHREYLVNAVSNGRPSGAAWFDSEVELMSERMVYGSAATLPASDGTTIPPATAITRGQLPLFLLQPETICFYERYWLRDPNSTTTFAIMYHDGVATNSVASRADRGVRPYFCIG